MPSAATWNFILDGSFSRLVCVGGYTIDCADELLMAWTSISNNDKSLSLI